MDSSESYESEETKEQDQKNNPPQQQQLVSITKPNEGIQINQNQIDQQESQQNQLQFNGFNVYYNNPEEVRHIMEQQIQDKVDKEKEINIQNQLNQSTSDLIERVCKVCFEGDEVVEDKGELIQPCICSGSCQYIHEQCLKTWIVSRGQNIFEAKCEICNHQYEIKYTREKRMNAKLSITHNGTGATITIVLSILFCLTFGVLVLFVIDIILTISSESREIIQQDSTLKFVALFIIFVFAVGFFLGTVQSFRENCIFDHIVNWTIFNFDRSKEKEDKQNQEGDEENNKTNLLIDQLNMLKREEQQQNQRQISQINNFDNSAYQSYQRHDTVSNLHMQANGISLVNQNVSQFQVESQQQQDQLQQQQQMDTDQISYLLNQLRSKQISPEPNNQDQNAVQNSAERLKLLELFGYKPALLHNQVIKQIQMVGIQEQPQREVTPTQQVFVGKKEKDYLNQPLQILNETQDANPVSLNKVKHLQKSMDLDLKYHSRAPSSQKGGAEVQSNSRQKCKSSNLVTINKINNTINYREQNNKSQLSINEKENSSFAVTHFQYMQKGNYTQSVEFLKSQVIPPQFIYQAKSPSQLIDVVLSYND